MSPEPPRNRHRPPPYVRSAPPRRSPSTAAPPGVPMGTVEQTLQWVGADAGRAQRALEAERVGRRRKTVLAKLERLGGGHAAL